MFGCEMDTRLSTAASGMAGLGGVSSSVSRSDASGCVLGSSLPFGAIVAGVIWLLASVAFSFYLSAFADYNETFGSLGAVAALLMWLWLSSFAICAGAEVNGVISRRERGLTTKTAKQKAEQTEKPRRFRRSKKPG